MTIRKRYFVPLLCALAATAVGCKDDAGPGLDAIATDAQIVALCDALIQAVEADSSSEQRKGFEEVDEIVAAYDYGSRSSSTARWTGALGESDGGSDGGSEPDGGSSSEPYTMEPTGPAELYRMYGFFALLNGNRSAALWCSLKAARENPGEPRGLSQAGVILLEEEKNEQAVIFLKKASHEAPDNDLFHVNLSTALDRIGEEAEAIDEAKEAVTQAPDRLFPNLALMDLYIKNNPSLREEQERMYTSCEASINEVIGLTSLEETSAFMMAKMAETGTITEGLMGILLATPLDAPQGYVDDLLGTHDEHIEQYTKSYDEPLVKKIEEIQDRAAKKREAAAVTLSSCCQQAPPGGACPCACFQDHCTEHLVLQDKDVFPNSYSALHKFLIPSLQLFKRHEIATLGEIAHYRSQLSDAAAEWSVRYIYKLLTMQCVTIALQVNHALTGAYTNKSLADATCEFESICRTAEEQARQAEQQRKIEEAREAEAKRLEAEARAKQRAKDDKAKGELCLDSVGCLGFDGSKVSVKVGGPVFASFSVDTAKFGVGVRVGVGVSDPTGGNVAGADLSLGGEITSSGSSIDIRHSQSYAAGTVKHDYNIVKLSSQF